MCGATPSPAGCPSIPAGGWKIGNGNSVKRASPQKTVGRVAASTGTNSRGKKKSGMRPVAALRQKPNPRPIDLWRQSDEMVLCRPRCSGPRLRVGRRPPPGAPRLPGARQKVGTATRLGGHQALRGLIRACKCRLHWSALVRGAQARDLLALRGYQKPRGGAAPTAPAERNASRNRSPQRQALIGLKASSPARVSARKATSTRNGSADSDPWAGEVREKNGDGPPPVIRHQRARPP